MSVYELTAPAQEDLKAIARYTLTEWGERQSLHYAELLDRRLREIATGAAHSRPFSTRYPQVLVSRCEHHYIFHIHPKGRPLQIIAVLHERMNLVARLKNRLDP